MLYKGSCHCGNIAFEAAGEIEAVVACNCSICARKGALLWAVPRDNLRLLTSEEGVGRYTFNNHTIEHRFCQTCGMNPYGRMPLRSRNAPPISTSAVSKASTSPPSR